MELTQTGLDANLTGIRVGGGPKKAGNLLCPFFMIGFPDYDTSIQAIEALVCSGVRMQSKLGMPIL